MQRQPHALLQDLELDTQAEPSSLADTLLLMAVTNGGLTPEEAGDLVQWDIDTIVEFLVLRLVEVQVIDPREALDLVGDTQAQMH